MTWTHVGTEYAISTPALTQSCAIPAGTIAGDAVLVLLTTVSPYYSTNSGASVSTSMVGLTLASLGYNPTVSPVYMRALRAYLYRHDGVATDVTVTTPVSDNYTYCAVISYRPPTGRIAADSPAQINISTGGASPDLSTTPETFTDALLLQGVWFWAAYPTLTITSRPGTPIAVDDGVVVDEVNTSGGGFSGAGTWGYDGAEYPGQLPWGFTIWLQHATSAAQGGWTVGALGFG